MSEGPSPRPVPNAWVDLDKTCPSCGYENHKMALRCRECGQDLRGTPQPRPASPWESGPPPIPAPFGSPAHDRPEGKRSAGNVFIALGLVVALAASAAVVVLVRPRATTTRTPSTGNAVPGGQSVQSGAARNALALAFHPGTSTRYRLTMQLNGTVTAGGRSAPLNLTVSEDLVWKYLSTDPDGTANVEVIESHVRVQGADGHTQWIDVPASYFEITPQGQILSGGDELFAGAGVGVANGAGIPGGPLLFGTQGFSAILPGRMVVPRQTWTKTLSVRVFGSPLKYVATSTYLRNERVGARTAAVVQSSMATSVKLGVRLAKYADQFGIDGQVPYKTVLHEAGRVSEVRTSWVDQRQKDLLKTTTTSHMAVQLWFTNAPGNLSIPTIGIYGTLSMTLQRR